MAKIRVGITIGDPSGIGPAITVRAVNHLKGLADFIVIADRYVVERAQSIEYRALSREYKVPSMRLIDLNNVNRKNFQFGKIKPEYGKASVEYLDKAVQLIKNNKIDCMVTCPVSKEAINLSGISFSGHTEYLACACGAKDLVMLLLNKYLKISLVTRHIPLSRVAKVLNGDKIEKTINLTHNRLKKIFSLDEPRLVVCGLNPHASDNGNIGNEENEIIKPALRKIRKRILNIDGPLPADTAMKKLKENKYDCAVAMYHDQALIPLKITDAASGINMTLGLPFVRTSPLHGTAFDIAGNFQAANPSSLIAAIKLAVKCSLNLRNT